MGIIKAKPQQGFELRFEEEGEMTLELMFSLITKLAYPTGPTITC